MIDPRFHATECARRIKSLFLMNLRRDAKPGTSCAASDREVALIEAVSTVVGDVLAKMPKPSGDE